MLIGKIGVSPFPKPLSVASNKFLITRRPSVEVSVPRLMEENGQLYYRKSFLSFTSGTYDFVHTLILPFK